MHDDGHTQCLPRRIEHDEPSAPSIRVTGEQLAAQVEAALLPLRARLAPAQLEIVSAVLCSSLETDPVSRLLMESAMRTRIENVKPLRAMSPSGKHEADGRAALDRLREHER